MSEEQGRKGRRIEKEGKGEAKDDMWKGGNCGHD